MSVFNYYCIACLSLVEVDLLSYCHQHFQIEGPWFRLNNGLDIHLFLAHLIKLYHVRLIIVEKMLSGSQLAIQFCLI